MDDKVKAMEEVKEPVEDNLSLKELIRQNFPVFEQEDLLAEMAQEARWFHHDQETQMVRVGEFPKWIPLVTKGAIKISRIDEEGGEIFLYYLYPGQTCAMTLNCCMVEKPSEIQAVAEAGTEFIGLPRKKLSSWMMQFDNWRSFTLQSYDERYENLLATIDAIAFQRLDERLLQLLEDKSIALGTQEVEITHKKLADELHSSREVISRLLKQLEKLGKVKLSRNKVTLT
jgi:cAMP-binding proteins - catabolite gene activator and regulatory subunit of cAMP-dependent protein kinases